MRTRERGVGRKKVSVEKGSAECRRERGEGGWAMAMRVEKETKRKTKEKRGKEVRR